MQNLSTSHADRSLSAESSVSAPSYRLEDWQKGYRSLKEEFDYWIDDIEGELPTDLQGTLFRNGPGLLDVNGQPIHHPFDGDGMVCAIALRDGRAHFRNRFVRTEGFVAEQQAQKILYRGVFGTQKPGGWLANLFDVRSKNLANTNVIYWGEKLLALWEGGKPYRLDPATLETLGLDTLEGALLQGEAFGAHPHVDPCCPWAGGKPQLVNFSIQPTGGSTKINLYELSLEGQVVHRQSVSVPGFAFMHDFAITPHYAVFFQNPVSFNPLPFLLGWRGAAECIQFKPGQSTRVLVMPRYADSDTRSPLQTFEVDAGFVFHHATAFEDGESLCVDSVCYADFPQVEPNQDFRQTKFATLPPGQLWRFRIHLPTGEVQRQLWDPRGCEFPVLHPQYVGRPYRYVYLGAIDAPEGNAPLQGILKVDWVSGDRQMWSAAPDGFVGEPIFVPRGQGGDEDEGWLLCWVFNARRDCSELVILDAQAVSAGPIARLGLKHHVPYGLHGTFVPHLWD